MTPDQFKMYQDSKRRQLEELQNAKSATKGKPMLKFFKNERKEVSQDAIDVNTMVELDDGTMMTVAEMQNALKKNSESEDDKAKADAEKKNADDKAKEEFENSMVDCDGEQMTIKEMKNRFSKMKKNDKEAEEKKNADDKAKADAEEKANAEEKEKQNARFKELQNAGHGGEAFADRKVVLETASDKLARGQERY